MQDIEQYIIRVSQGGVDDPADDASAPPPEAGEAYRSPEPPTQEAVELDEDDFEDEETTETDEQPEAKAETTEPPAKDDRYEQLQRQYEQEREARLKMEGQLDALMKGKQPQTEKQSEAQQRKVYKLLEQYKEDGGDEGVAGRLKAMFDAVYDDFEAKVNPLSQFSEYAQQQMARSEAAAEKRQAEDTMRSQYAATAEELEAAEKFAQQYYQKVANGQAAFKDYGDLYEMHILRARHTGKQQAKSEDEAAEKQRLEAQRRANPGAGAKSSSKLGPLAAPKEAKGDFQKLQEFWRTQGVLIDG